MAGLSTDIQKAVYFSSAKIFRTWYHRISDPKTAFNELPPFWSEIKQATFWFAFSFDADDKYLPGDSHGDSTLYKYLVCLFISPSLSFRPYNLPIVSKTIINNYWLWKGRVNGLQKYKWKHWIFIFRGACSPHPDGYDFVTRASNYSASGR